MTTDIPYPTEFELLLESYPNFNRQVTIEHEGVELGTISVSFTAKETDEEETDEHDSGVSHLYDAIISELWSLTYHYLRNDIKLAIKQAAIFERQSRSTYLTLLSFYLDEDKLLEIAQVTNLSDDEALRFIENEGPLSLRISEIQNKLYEWISDPENAASKADNFKNRLLDFGAGRTKIGGPKADLAEKYGTEWIPYMYEDIKYILKSTKQQFKAGKSKDLESLIRKGLYKTITNRIKSQEGQIPPEVLQAKKNSLKILKSSKITDPLTEVIKKRFYRNLDSPRWTPYQLALDILADFLGVSQDWIKKRI
ncbi:hypothetical protein ACFLR7_04335 [Acidobacteriota bacterium]